MNTTEPLIKQGWLRVLIFFIGFYLFQIIGGAAIGIIIVLIKGANSTKETLDAISSADSTVLIALMVLFNFITALLLVFIFRKFIDRRTVYSLGWNFSDNKLNAFVGLFAGIASVGAGTLILAAMKNLRFTGWMVEGEDLIISLGIMILVAVAEELMFRGYILSNLMQSTNKYIALLVSAILFGVAHLSNPNFNWLTFVNIFLAGLFLGINYIYTQNLWYAILLHFAWNFFQGPVLGYEVSGLNFQSLLQQELNGNEMITGGKFGFEGSIVATVMMIIFTLIMGIVYRRKSLNAIANIIK